MPGYAELQARGRGERPAPPRKKSAPPKRRLSPPRISLSDVVGSGPQKVKVVSGKLSAVGKGITKIDTLPEASRVETLFLSENNLSTLAGIEQFVSLKKLSASDNCLAELEALAPLRELPYLITVNLQSNPVSQMPFYRMHLASLCPKATLDSKPPPAADQVKEVLQQEAGYVQRAVEMMRVDEVVSGCVARGSLNDDHTAMLEARLEEHKLHRPTVHLDTLLRAECLKVAQMPHKELVRTVRHEVRKLRMRSDVTDLDSVQLWAESYEDFLHFLQTRLGQNLDAFLRVYAHRLHDPVTGDVLYSKVLDHLSKAERAEITSPSLLPAQQPDPGTPDAPCISPKKPARGLSPGIRERQLKAEREHKVRQATSRKGSPPPAPCCHTVHGEQEFSAFELDVMQTTSAISETAHRTAATLDSTPSAASQTPLETNLDNELKLQKINRELYNRNRILESQLRNASEAERALRERVDALEQERVSSSQKTSQSVQRAEAERRQLEAECTRLKAALANAQGEVASVEERCKEEVRALQATIDQLEQGNEFLRKRVAGYREEVKYRTREQARGGDEVLDKEQEAFLQAKAQRLAQRQLKRRVLRRMREVFRRRMGVRLLGHVGEMEAARRALRGWRRATRLARFLREGEHLYLASIAHRAFVRLYDYRRPPPPSPQYLTVPPRRFPPPRQPLAFHDSLLHESDMSSYGDPSHGSRRTTGTSITAVSLSSGRSRRPSPDEVTSRSQRRWFRRWRHFYAQQKRQQAHLLAAIRHYFHHLNSTAFTAWRSWVAQARAERRDTLKQSFAVWRRGSVESHRRKANKRLGEVVRGEKDGKLMRACLSHWAGRSHERLRLQRTYTHAIEVLQRRRQRYAFEMWKGAAVKALVALRKKYRGLEDEFEEQKDRLASAGLTHAQLVESISNVTEEVARYQVELQSMGEVLAQKEKALRESIAVQRALKAQLASSEGVRSTTEVKMKCFRDELVATEHDATQREAQHLLAVRAADKRIESLSTQLVQTQGGLDEVQRELSSAKQELDDAQETGATTAQAMLHLTSQLRRTIRKQEDDLAKYDADRSHHERNRELLARELQEAHSRVTGNQERLDGVVREYQSKLQQLRTQEAQTATLYNTKKYEAEAQGYEVKRLRHELRLVEERERDHRERIFDQAFPLGKAGETSYQRSESSGEVEELLRRARKAKEQLAERESLLRKEGTQVFIDALRGHTTTDTDGGEHPEEVPTPS